MTRKRRPLDSQDDAIFPVDDDAQKFVYGSAQPVEPEQTKPTILEKIMDSPDREPTVRITVDLPQSMHKKLSLLAAESGRKKAEIIRALLSEILD